MTEIADPAINSKVRSKQNFGEHPVAKTDSTAEEQSPIALAAGEFADSRCRQPKDDFKSKLSKLNQKLVDAIRSLQSKKESKGELLLENISTHHGKDLE